MGGAPVIEYLRPGVGYAPDAAASMRRLEAALGRPHDCNSSTRDYDLQERMWKAWEAWVAGRGPKPNHSRAVAPWLSKHCMGLADDSDDWTTPGYIALAEEHGWIRTAADDPTERHHFEYQWWRDQHRNDPAPAGNTTTPTESEEDDDMRTPAMFYTTKNDLPATASNPVDTYIITDTNGYYSPVSGVSGDYASRLAQAYQITVDAKHITRDHARRIEQDCAAMRSGK